MTISSVSCSLAGLSCSAFIISLFLLPARFLLSSAYCFLNLADDLAAASGDIFSCFSDDFSTRGLCDADFVFARTIFYVFLAGVFFSSSGFSSSSGAGKPLSSAFYFERASLRLSYIVAVAGAFSPLPTLLPSVMITCWCKFSWFFVIIPMGVKFGSMTGTCKILLKPLTQRSRSSMVGAKNRKFLP